MAELKTEPGWRPARDKGKPWWAVAIAGGFGAVLAVLFALGLLTPAASAHEPPVHTAGISESPQRLDRIEQRLNEISERLARIEGRLERK